MKEDHIKNPVSEELRGELESEAIILCGNTQTLRSELICRYPFDFEKPRNIGSILGFTNIKLAPFILHQSNDLVDILQFETIKVQWDIINRSYSNVKPDHPMFELSHLYHRATESL